MLTSFRAGAAEPFNVPLEERGIAFVALSLQMLCSPASPCVGVLVTCWELAGVVLETRMCRCSLQSMFLLLGLGAAAAHVSTLVTLVLALLRISFF